MRLLTSQTLARHAEPHLKTFSKELQLTFQKLLCYRWLTSIAAGKISHTGIGNLAISQAWRSAPFMLHLNGAFD